MNILQKIVNFFRIEKADTPVIVVREQMDAQARRGAYRLWYRGSAHELAQFYKGIDDTGRTFWGSVPTAGREIRKAHTGLPKIIVDTLTKITVSDLNNIDFQDTKQEELWNRIADENDFINLLKRATKETLYIGDGAFKFSLDEKISREVPVIEWYPGDRVETKMYRGHLQELIFKSEPFKVKDKKYVLVEHYGHGYIRHTIVDENGKEQNIQDFPDYAHLQDVETAGEMLAVMMKITESESEVGRGQSIFDGKVDNLDALDESYSQWLQAMRAGRPTKYIPEKLLERDPENGGVLTPSAFDNEFVAIADDMSEGAKNEIKVMQPDFPAENYNLTYLTNLDLCLQGLISPSTLGVDVKKLDNAESQREKEKTTLYTRAAIIEALTQAIKDVVETAFHTLDIMAHHPLSDVDIDVTFGEYANPSFEAVVETLSNPNTPMSIEAKVEEMWGRTKDDEWKKQEVARIKEQSGIVTLDEPALSNPQKLKEGVDNVE